MSTTSAIIGRPCQTMTLASPIAAGTTQRIIDAQPPIIQSGSEHRRGPRVHPLAIFLLIVFFLVGLGLWWVTGIFRLGSETSTLKSSFMAASGADWRTRIALNLGRVTFGLVQFGTSFIQMPREGRAALNGLNQAEVGVYETARSYESISSSAILAATDKAMEKRGCVRIVGVIQRDNLVAVYVPKKGKLNSQVHASVLVLHENRLVVAGVRANPNELMKLIPEGSLASIRSEINHPGLPRIQL